MIFSKHNLSSWIFFLRGRASLRFRLSVCALALVSAAVGLSRPHLPSAQAQQTSAPETGALYGGASLDRLKQGGQYDSLQAALRQARLTVSRAEATPLGRAAWHAPNPSAGYDAYVTEEGVSVAINNRTIVSLSLNSIGYGEALQYVAPGEVFADKQTISITREGGVLEWFVNGPDGLEHGFTLSEPPGERPQGVPLRLALRVSYGWRAVASDDGKAVTLRGADDQAVEYGKLVVSDSLGRNIPARLTVAGEQVVIEAEDGEASYPLAIDPIFTLQQKLTATDGATYDHFGAAVALSGDTLVVGADGDDIGANENQGSVYVFARSGSTWTLQQKLTANDGATKDLFGSAVALDGDTLAVGAQGSDVGANGNQGSVYVFTRNGATWTQRQKLTAADGVAGDLFGKAVSLSGDSLVAGAFGADIGANLGQGAAYVFTRSGSTWTQQQKLTAADGAAGDTFGYAVSLSGDSVVVGAYGADTGANIDQGSAYVFTRSGSTWTQQQKLTAADGAASDLFGVAVAHSGDTVVIGASDDDDNTANEGDGAILNQGSAYVFARSGAVWTLQQKLTASDGAFYDHFGAAVALDGDTLAVSAHEGDVGANSNQGSVYVFARSGAVWTQQQKLIASDGATSDLFGVAVALRGGALAVGANLDDISSNLDLGSVYVFAIPSCPSLTLAPATLPNGVKGISYQQQITVSGGFGPYQFAVTGGALPPGLTLSPNGLLSGTPTKQGTYNFTFRATDLSSGCSGARKYTIKIAAS